LCFGSEVSIFMLRASLFGGSSPSQGFRNKAVFFFFQKKRFSENLLLWLNVEAECSLGLALLVGDDQRVLSGVPGSALHHVKADLVPRGSDPVLHRLLLHLLPVLHPGDRGWSRIFCKPFSCSFRR